jgi:hypothetical protein
MHLAVCVSPFMDFLRTDTRTNQAKKCGKEKRQCKRVKPVHEMLSTSRLRDPQNSKHSRYGRKVRFWPKAACGIAEVYVVVASRTSARFC